MTEEKNEVVELNVTLREIQNFENSTKKKMSLLINQDKKIKNARFKKAKKERLEVEKIGELEIKLEALKAKRAELLKK